MSPVRPAMAHRWAQPKASEGTEKRRVPAAALEATGLRLSRLFAGGPTAARRVDSISPRGLEVDGCFLPRRVAPAAVEGQWLRFERSRGEAVRVSVDLRATLDGEQRWTDLFQQLTT